MDKEGLIIHTGGFGDWIMFTPVVKILKEYIPDLRLNVLTSDKFSYNLIKLYTEEKIINRLEYLDFVMRKSDLLKCIFKNFWKNYNFIMTTTAFNSIKGELFYLLLKGNIKIFRTTKPKVYFYKKNWLYYNYFGKHQVEQNLELLKFILPNLQNFNFNREIKPFVPIPKDINPKNLDCSDVLIHVGTSKGGYIRRYPITKFLEVANILKKEGFKVKFILGPAEIELSEFIKKSSFEFIYVNEIILNPLNSGHSQLVEVKLSA